MNIQRIRGVFRRHYYVWFFNPEYMLDTFWHPVVDLLIWGFVTLYLQKSSVLFEPVAATLLGAVILWAVFRRGQHEVNFGFLEEAWSRSLLNFFSTPVTLGDFLAGTALFGMVKLLIEMSLMLILAQLLFSHSLFQVGLMLVPYVFSLMLTGWAFGMLVNAVMVRFGRGLVALSWITTFVIQPFACVFYPMSALPDWAQVVARLLPCSYVFEGMRSILNGHGPAWETLAMSFALNGLYLAAAFLAFSRVMDAARKQSWLPRLEW